MLSSRKVLASSCVEGDFASSCAMGDFCEAAAVSIFPADWMLGLWMRIRFC